MSSDPARRGVVVVRVPEGLHLRPLTLITRTAQKFECNISLRRGNQTADAKRPLDLMTLAASCGDELELSTEGKDSDAAYEAIEALFAADFEEGDGGGET